VPPEHVARRVSAATGGKFDIRVFAAGEIVPPLGVVDAVQQGNVECAHTSAYFFFGKDPTFAFDTGISFGMNARQMNAWSYDGGGMQLMREFYRDYNIVHFPCANTGAQPAGWFRKEIKGLDDLKGSRCVSAGSRAP
jgi:TRAP-type mannitol/chloroaromatic compound transport system substrate-binding protein